MKLWVALRPMTFTRGAYGFEELEAPVKTC